MIFGDGGLQQCVAITVVAVDFEFFQIYWQFVESKCADAAGGEIEPGAALRLGPMHVVGMLMSHERARLNLLQ